jgi:Raf kinase inhibitor-like YbhB/YbcL family protein
MKLSTTAFVDAGAIPSDYAFCMPDPKTHVTLSTNLNPDLAWADAPTGTESFALLCHDPDVPSKGDDVNKKGRSVPATLPRVDFFHWVLIDLPRSTSAIARGAHSNEVTPRGKEGPKAPGGGRHGINDYTAWFENDLEMFGDYYGYDGPCPPWNDELVHRYVFTLYALDVARLEVPARRFTGTDVRNAMRGHVLAEASLSGRYTLNPLVKL